MANKTMQLLVPESEQQGKGSSKARPSRSIRWGDVGVQPLIGQPLLTGNKGYYLSDKKSHSLRAGNLPCDRCCNSGRDSLAEEIMRAVDERFPPVNGMGLPEEIGNYYGDHSV